MQPIRNVGRHITMPATASLVEYHLVDDIGVIFFKGKYLVAVDGKYYEGTTNKPNLVKTMRDMMEEGGQHVREGIGALLTGKRIKPFRVRDSECRRGKAPAHITGLPDDVFVTWFHSRVNLCRFDQIDEEGTTHLLIAYEGRVYQMQPKDNPHYTDEFTNSETHTRMRGLLADRPTFTVNPVLDLNALADLQAEATWGDRDDPPDNRQPPDNREVPDNREPPDTRQP